MFEPLDILYIVLAFAVVWITAAVIWLIWQVASVVRSANEAIKEVRESATKIEKALTAIKHRFEYATTNVGAAVSGIGKVIDYAIEKKRKMGKDDAEE